MNFWETATQLSGFNETLVDELNSKKILLIGSGGLAHPLLTSLCGSGLTTFDIADGDVIEYKNLHRQFLFNEKCIGQGKARVLKSKLEDHYPQTNISIIEKFLEEKDLFEQIPNYDLIIDCSDNFKTRYNINEVCVEKNIPLVMGLASGVTGHAAAFLNYANSPCYECIFPRNTNINEDSCDEVGILTPVLSYVSSIVAMMTIRIILDQFTKENFLYRIDGMTLKTNQTLINKDKECFVCKK